MFTVTINIKIHFRITTVNRNGMVSLGEPRDKYVIVHFLFTSRDEMMSRVKYWKIYSKQGVLESIISHIFYFRRDTILIVEILNIVFTSLKCHCNEKIFDPILNTTERHFSMSQNGVFNFSQSRFVFEIFRFLKYAN